MTRAVNADFIIAALSVSEVSTVSRNAARVFAHGASNKSCAIAPSSGLRILALSRRYSESRSMCVCHARSMSRGGASAAPRALTVIATNSSYARGGEKKRVVVIRRARYLPQEGRVAADRRDEEVGEVGR